MLLVVGVTGIAWQWRKAERARVEQAKALAHLQSQEIGRWLEEGDAARALAYLASLIRERPDRWQAVMYALSIVEQHSFPVLAWPEIHPPAKLVSSAAFAPDGSWLAAAGGRVALPDGACVARIWDAVSGQPLREVRRPLLPLSFLALDHSGARLTAAGLANDVTVYDVESGLPVSPPMRHHYFVVGLSASADGTRTVSHGWDLETGAELWPPNHQPGYVRPGAISPDGTRIIAGHNDGHIRIYDTATGARVQTLNHPGEVKVLRFAPDGSGRFLSASTDRLAHVWDL